MNNHDHESLLKRITHRGLCELLKVTRPQPVGIVTRTPARLKRRGHELGDDVIKISFRHVWIGVHYENLVNNRRTKEGRPLNPDGSIPLFWSHRLWGGAGMRVPGNRHLRRHRKSGRLYLAFWPIATKNELFQRDNGKRLELAQVKPHLRADALRDDGTGLGGPSGHQGLRKSVRWKTVALDHLESIRIAGQQYLIRHPILKK